MARNFNVKPYYDDFDGSKNYHRILFKPGAAVQARELTQAQTILQDQVTKFADNIFKQNSPVTGGQITTNFGVNYIKLQETYSNTPIDVTQFDGLLIQNTSGSIIARVLAVAETSGTEPPTLVVTYLSGERFTENDILFSVDNANLQAQVLDVNATGSSSVASISEGVFYVVNGYNYSSVQNPDGTLHTYKISESTSTTPTSTDSTTSTQNNYDNYNHYSGTSYPTTLVKVVEPRAKE